MLAQLGWDSELGNYDSFSVDQDDHVQNSEKIFEILISFYLNFYDFKI